jgi:hypothetical protein
MALSFLSQFLPWPFSTAAKLALARPGASEAATRAARADYSEPPVMTSPVGHLSVVAGGATKLVFAAAVYRLLGPPDLEAARALALPWVASVAARDLLITWLIGGSWDWLHLSPSSPLYATLRPYRFAGEDEPYPSAARVSHDFFWASVSALVSTGWEVALLHLCATRALPLAALPGDRWWADARTVLALLALPHFQIVHFYATHRVMHRWFAPGRAPALVPDVGAFLYRHVHSLHHRAKDPSAFSGISMHPVESALFFTTMPIACLLGLHPIAMLHAKFFNISAAMLGHESFGDPSTGGHGHWLHHKLVNCNFGGNFVPLDHWLGTYARDEADFEKRFLGLKEEPGEGGEGEGKKAA